MTERNRLRLRLTITGLVVSLAIGIGAHWLVKDAVRTRFAERARAETNLLDAWLSAWTGSLTDLVNRAAHRVNGRVTLIEAGGRVVADSAIDPKDIATLENHTDRPEIQQARLQVTGQSFRRSDTTAENYLYSARVTSLPGEVKFVRVAYPLEQVERVIWHYDLLILGLVLLTVIPLTALAYASARSLSRPLESMAAALEKTSGGQGRLELPESRSVELIRVAGALKSMQQQLLEKIGELDSERDVLASVVSGIQEGLLLLGPDREIRLSNRAARDIFGLQGDPAGSPVTEVVRHPAVIRGVDVALAENRETREAPIRIDNSGRSFSLQVTPLAAAEGGALLLLFDVSRLEALERVRREFVANVSHELRTPLTSIKASVESLIDDDLVAVPHRFLEIIRRNADHMEALVEDLTDLSLIETGAVTLDMRSVDLTALSKEIAERLGPVASASGVEILVDLPPGFLLRGDRRRLEQMLANLVENAIKFNREGGHVRIHGTLRGTSHVVFVEDTGVGIPSDSADRVFNRFVQLNQERSRKHRGTGLGLAIVKHLMRLHGGSVRVESELRVGSTFILEFPAPRNRALPSAEPDDLHETG